MRGLEPRLIGVLLGVAALILLAAPAQAAVQEADPDDAIVVINGDVEVAAGDVVEGVFVVHGDVRIDGRVDGDVYVISGETTVRGDIDGDLVSISDRARLLPGSRVGGDLHFGDEEPVVSPRATVEGEIRDEDWWDAAGVIAIVGFVALWLAITLSSLVLGLLLLLLAPRAADAVLREWRAQPWVAVAVGLGISIALPIVGFLATATLLGLPLGLAVLSALIPLLAVGYVTGAWLLGRTLVKEPRDRVVSYLAGWGVVRGAALVPVLGLLVSTVVAVIGLGALAMAAGSAGRD